MCFSVEVLLIFCIKHQFTLLVDVLLFLRNTKTLSDSESFYNTTIKELVKQAFLLVDTVRNFAAPQSDFQQKAAHI